MGAGLVSGCDAKATAKKRKKEAEDKLHNWIPATSSCLVKKRYQQFGNNSKKKRKKKNPRKAPMRQNATESIVENKQQN